VPRFYFDLCNGNGFTEDEEGQDLPDVGAARAQAISGARDIMAGEVKQGMLDLSSFIEVKGERRERIFTLGFDEALELAERH
jgi:hypothetical protein